MKITIAGAGAMGSRFGLMLHNAGHEVVLVDGWKDHVEAIQKEGLKANFNGEEVVVKLPALLQSEVTESATSDLIILFTKAMQLEKMLSDLKSVIHEKTKVLCLLNGIGHEEVIEKFVPKENIFIGNTMWTAGMEGPGRVKLFGSGTVALKNLVDTDDAKEGALEIVEVLNSAGLNANYSENILYAIYKKACVNGTMNGLCTILLSNMYEFGSTTDAHMIVEYIESNCYNCKTIGLHYPSMYQDLNKNNRLTEIDYINGAVVRKGKKYGIPTPYCAFLTALVHCKEQILGAK